MLLNVKLNVIIVIPPSLASLARSGQCHFKNPVFTVVHVRVQRSVRSRSFASQSLRSHSALSPLALNTGYLGLLSVGSPAPARSSRSLRALSVSFGCAPRSAHCLPPLSRLLHPVATLGSRQRALLINPLIFSECLPANSTLQQPKQSTLRLCGREGHQLLSKRFSAFASYGLWL